MSILVVALVILTLASGFFSGSETALFSLSAMRVRGYRHHPDRKRRLIAKLLKKPRDLLVTILMLNVLVNILVQNVASNIFADYRGWLLKVGVPLGLTLLFGELLPKSIAFPNNERISSWVAQPIGLLHSMLSIVRRFVVMITSTISRFSFFFLRKPAKISHDELEHALRASQKEEILSKEEADLLSGYLKFQHVLVKEVMRPREDVIAYEMEEPISKLEQLFIEEECSRVPVLNGGIENIKGVVEASDFFSTKDLKKILRKPFFAPESMKAKVLLEKMAERDEQLAVVVDEYGSVAGLVTREDLFEVVVGEIADRRDQKTLLTRAGPNVLIASGKLEIAEFNSTFGANLSSNMVTLGGWVIEQLGEVPNTGTKFEKEGFLFHILAADPNRVCRIYVRRLAL